MKTPTSPILTPKAIKLGWKLYLTSEGKYTKEIPAQLQRLFDLNDTFIKQDMHTDPYNRQKGFKVFEYTCTWYENMILYKGDNPETATDWIFITNNARCYKVGAKYAAWTTRDAKLFDNDKYRDRWFPGRMFLSALFGPLNYLIKVMDNEIFY